MGLSLCSLLLGCVALDKLLDLLSLGSSSVDYNRYPSPRIVVGCPHASHQI